MAVEFRNGPFDASAGDYGDVLMSGALSGVITPLRVVDQQVAIDVAYPGTGLSTPLGFITGMLSGTTLTVDDDEVVIPGFVAWRGPVVISAVPELGSMSLMALPGAACCWVCADAVLRQHGPPEGLRPASDSAAAGARWYPRR